MAILTARGRFVVLFLACTLCQPVWSQDADYDGPEHGEFLRNWLLLGPIVLHTGDGQPDTDALKKAGGEGDLLAADGGEANIVPTAGQKSEEHGRWKLFESDEDTIDLGKALELKSWAVAYAAATVHSDEDATVVLGVGSDDNIKIWLNGEVVHENSIGRPVRLDDDLVTVKLTKGENRLLLKVMNAELDWGFACRFLSKENMASQLVKAAASRDEENIKDLLAAGADINAQSDFGLTAYLAAKMKGNDKIARMLEVLGADTNVVR